MCLLLVRIDCVNDKSKFQWKTPSFSLTNFGGYFNITKTPASDITVFYILLKEFLLFWAFSTIKCERVNMSIFVGIFHLVYSCPLQSKLKQLN